MYQNLYVVFPFFLETMLRGVRKGRGKGGDGDVQVAEGLNRLIADDQVVRADISVKGNVLSFLGYMLLLP